MLISVMAYGLVLLLALGKLGPGSTERFRRVVGHPFFFLMQSFVNQVFRSPIDRLFTVVVPQIFQNRLMFFAFVVFVLFVIDSLLSNESAA